MNRSDIDTLRHESRHATEGLQQGRRRALGAMDDAERSGAGEKEQHVDV